MAIFRDIVEKVGQTFGETFLKEMLRDAKFH